MDNYECGCDCRVNRNMSCGDIKCTDRKPFPCNTSLAMAYVPFQQWGEVYNKEKALSCGTLFPCLNLPFMGCMK